MTTMSTNALAGIGAGRHRKPFKIKEWMFSCGLTQYDIRDQLGLSQSVVSRTIYGSANNRRVLGYLRDAGCPEEALALPKDMKEKEVA
ncbi:MAG: hypothetical protein AB7E51_08430 [Pseudodesulfovibrio sp.]|uniref:hypothetical protein n=1 Tax=Pseudodesulfovibrio sp. TaxID=2035812 RepID=UPI003D09C20A